MPSNVAWFERLMYLAIAIGVAVFALDYPRIVALTKSSFKEQFQQMNTPAADFETMIEIVTTSMMVAQAVMIGLFILLIWLAARRRKNWARWVIAVLFGLGMPSYFYGLPQLFGSNPVLGAISVAQVTMQIYALYLIFTGNARDWFEEVQHA